MANQIDWAARLNLQTLGGVYPVYPVYPTNWLRGTRGTVFSPDHRAGSGRERTGAIGKDVLVVDDEPYLCDLIADVLEAEGHTTRKAAHGLEALERVRERKPQLILVDLMMPVMDGWEFVQTLSRNPEWADIPVVIITAHYQVARAQKELNARAVITKPFDIDQLSRVVDAFAN